MKILIVHRYFWPDTPPYASTLRTIAVALAAANHDVTVVSAQPSYGGRRQPRQPRRERLDRVDVIRCRLLSEHRRMGFARAINSVVFALIAGRRVASRRRYDVVMTATSPPVILAAVVSAVAILRGTRFVYHNQDIYPEMAVQAHIMPNSGMAHFLRRIDLATCRRATAIVVLSEDMRSTHVLRGLDGNRIRVINNFDLEERSERAPVPDKLRRPDGSFQIIYAGNIGRFQGLPNVIEAAGLLRDEPSIRFDFLGDGVLFEQLQTQAGDMLGHTVFFHGRYPHETAMRAVEQADLGLVSLDPGIIRLAYPGKTMGFLAAGLPLLAVVEVDSELAKMVLEEQIGYVAPPGDSKALAGTIRDAYEGRESLHASAVRARAVFHSRFAREVALQRWVALFEEIDKSQQVAGTPGDRI